MKSSKEVSLGTECFPFGALVPRRRSWNLLKEIKTLAQDQADILRMWKAEDLGMQG